MEVRNGFIVGIYNYCDRWCEACRFTSRCRTFAGCAEVEARSDPNFRELAALHERDEERRPVPDWLLKIIEEAEASIERGEDDDVEPALALAHKPIVERAERYTHSVFDWLRTRDGSRSTVPSDPCAVVTHYSAFISGKVHRAVMGLAILDEHDRDYPSDADGSAKAAVLAMERSRDAWQALLQTGGVRPAQAKCWIEELTWLIAALDRVFPNARGFVRPGFDEPELVARLEAQEPFEPDSR